MSPGRLGRFAAVSEPPLTTGPGAGHSRAAAVAPGGWGELGCTAERPRGNPPFLPHPGADRSYSANSVARALTEELQYWAAAAASHLVKVRPVTAAAGPQA